MKTILIKFGFNKAIVYFIASKGFLFIATPITLYLITTYFTPQVQGYYYTFSSLLGISILFELGLAIVIQQFASHEYAHLSWDNRGTLTGDAKSLSLIISLARKSLRWYGIVSFLFVVIIIPSGLYFLKSNARDTGLSYTIPWILLIIFFGFSTALLPLTSILEGCGKIAEVQKIRLTQSVIGVFGAWIAIRSHGNLFTSVIEFAIYWLVLVIWLLFKYRNFIRQILNTTILSQDTFSWFHDIFPMQWKIAVSWMAAYFMNYLFIPLLFKYRGAVEAGQMGMSMKFSSLVYLLSIAWISMRTPDFGAMIKKREIQKLEALVIRSTLQAAIVGILTTIGAIVGILVLNNYTNKFVGRIIPLTGILFLCLASVLGVIAAGIASYLRAHKEEPLMGVTILIAIISAISCFITAKYYNASSMAFMYFLISLCVGVPAHVYILHKKRKIWYK